MPASFIGEFILQPILEFLLHFCCYYVGRVIVPVATLGRVKCDRLTIDRPRRKLQWGGLSYRRGQLLYLTAEGTALAGLLFIVVVVAGGLLVYYHGT